MTEYELASLGMMYVNVADSLLMSFFTILTAYLFAGYAASHRLSLPVAIFVTMLFLVGSAYFIVRTNATADQIQNLIGKMRDVAQAGKGFEWSATVRGPAAGGYAMQYGLLALMVAGVIGSIYFFFLMRRHNRQAAI